MKFSQQKPFETSETEQKDQSLFEHRFSHNASTQVQNVTKPKTSKIEEEKPIVKEIDRKEPKVMNVTSVVSQTNSSKIQSVASSFLMLQNKHEKEKSGISRGSKQSLQELITQEQIGQDININSRAQDDECTISSLS